MKISSAEIEHSSSPEMLFDREVEQMNADWHRKPSDFFEVFLKQLTPAEIEHFSKITLHGGPKNDEDRAFLQRCRNSFVELVDQGDVKID